MKQYHVGVSVKGVWGGRKVLIWSKNSDVNVERGFCLLRLENNINYLILRN
jgi:hypothetical protein